MQDHYIIIGGSHGIGFGLTQRLLASGHAVSVVSRSSGDLNLSAPSLQHYVADVTTDTGLDSLGELFAQPTKGLAYCPGSINLGPLRSLTNETLHDEFQLNVVAAVRCTQMSIKALRASSGGSIVLFSTVAVRQGMPMHCGVSAIKGAIEGLTRSMAAELAPSVRVNAIAPALVDTPLAARLLSTDEKRTALGKRHPLGRVGTIEDIATAAEYLITDASAWVTGQILGIDGGLSVVRTG